MTDDKVWVLDTDLHCGCPVSLTSEPRNAIQKELLKARRECVKAWHQPDVVLEDGDAIHGSDAKGHDVQEGDLFKQCDDAVQMIAEWDAKEEYIIVTGTPFHTNIDGVPLETYLKTKLELTIRERGSKAKVTLVRKVNVIINDWFRMEARHKIGSSRVPYGRKTMPERAKFWNVINAALTSQRKGLPAQWPHLIVYGHVHYYGFSEDTFGAAMTLPCWQALGSRYGDEQCEGHVDIGAVRLRIGSRKEQRWGYEKMLWLPAMGSRQLRR